jgi:GNAT superfamily N-acetyltransferase
LALIYRGFSPPILFTFGDSNLLEPLLAEIAGEPLLSLHVRPDVLPLLAAHYRITEEKSVWRMVVCPKDFRPAAMENAVRLGAADADRVRLLYADGAPSGESPEYFAASSLDDGVFFGIREQGNLVAVAGTHLVSVRESVAAIGNVYTRRDRRGFGLAAQATSAVAKELLRLSIGTIALNARQQNLPAIRVYERLGFKTYCLFCEGLASR